eukprot:CAMPEP_0185034954 /NCGR_PEP_ID=MMETSP1103-20130426/25460_1 /TAXON_ID=36769 /ORGANISM="Paraphysomonas bandaiensis, Strain Caron Lab Isolate" /LENGTH=758 /DNA_ID=CAMNT_0027571817 /DNA_START=185 /DNA_END=2461 /DNA_ORIENTATION=+
MDATQEEVFKRVGTAAVQNALDGFNSTIFAYGQTGSGKTFTITGGTERYTDRGIIPRAISMIFGEFRKRTDVQFKGYVSYLELYNEQGYDLLDPSHDTKGLEDLPKVSMLEDEHGNFHLKNLSMNPVTTEEEALNLLFLGDTNRAIAETPMNLASSRSHCIFTIAMEVRDNSSDKVRRSKLHLVDLAGSERVGKTNSSGSVLSEAKYINSSLFFLEMVIVALHEKATKGRQHVPYRNSMMTSVLRDSLGGNCKTIMIATINPEKDHTEESLSTCRFAQRVSLIKNKATINEGSDPELVIKRLKNEVLTLREEIAFLKGEAGEGDALTPQAAEELKEKIRQYCDDTDPLCILNIGELTITKIKDAFAIFKNLVLEARQSSKGGGWGDGAGEAAEKDREQSGDTAELLQQIKDLKSCLLQRDNEIAILVNMVKKERSAASSGGGMVLGEEKAARADEGRYIDDDRVSEVSAKGSSSGSGRGAGGRGRGGGGIMTAEEREALRSEKIIKRHLYGVPPPEDKAIFDDMSACFEYFRANCELRDSIEENKTILKEKMKEAQSHGERANQSRNTITYLKNSIESIRREHALQKMTDGADGKDEDGEEMSAEENTYRRAIEQEKAVYRESFEKLRVLKPEIEHIRKILEKGRATLQNQFDTWYNNLHSRDGAVLSQPRRSLYQGGQPQRDGGDRSGHVSAEADVKRAWATPEPSPGSKPSYREVKVVSRGKSQAINDSDGEDDVNEDIMAFHKAKEELMKRRNGA